MLPGSESRRKIEPQLHARWWTLAAALFVLLLTSRAIGQILDQPGPQPVNQQLGQIQDIPKPKKRGARAIAVLEFLPGGGARLVPVALWLDGQFYDASLYEANPEPLALEPETVYEATDYGRPTGLFTVTRPEEIKGSWIGAGQWKPHQSLDEMAAKKPAAKFSKPTQSFNVNEDRPILKRAGSGSSSNPGGSGDSGASQSPSSSTENTKSPDTITTPNPPDRPTLKKSPDSSTAPATSSPAAAPANDGSTSAASLGSSPDERDPNRPLLRYGKPKTETSASEPALPVEPSAAMGGTQAKLMMGPMGRRSYPAVSDAGPYQTRSFLYVMSPAERADKLEQMHLLAMDAIRKFIVQRKTPAIPKNATITDDDLRIFDLEASNSPTLVFTGTLPVPGVKTLRAAEFKYFVTVVAHEDIDGAPIQIFSSVTNSNYLDAFPRMEIIDAVDADANGRGDLLFRQYSDGGISYSLYRVYPFDMRKIFQGGAGM